MAHASSWGHWEPPGGTVVDLIGVARAAVTGRPSRSGENHEVSY
ncbi:hypothetical protein [Micromonospora sp. KC606]|nr:hypothetical protein [Micromonospora sp. KC606]